MPALTIPYAAVIVTPIGKLGICVSEAGLSKLDFLTSDIALISPIDSLAQIIIQQLQTYFENPSHRFLLPLDIKGTSFQRSVWRALQGLKKPITYGELARLLNTAPRAIGGACRNNPVPIIIPCHRILAADKKLGGFCGATQGHWLSIKKWLLRHEGHTIKD